MSVNHIYAGVPDGAEALLLSSPFADQLTLYICATEAKARRLVEQLEIVSPSLHPLYFPAWDCLPYDRVSSGLDVMTMRINVLTTLLEPTATPRCVITSVAALLQRLPPKSSLEGQSLTIQMGKSLKRDHLLKFLNEMGYVRSETVRESGEYAVRGGIIDFFPTSVNDPVRIDFFGDEVDQLRSFDAMTQTTLSALDTVVLKPVSELTLTPEGISHFRTRYRELFGAANDPLYEAISAGRKYGGMEHWLPLFFEKCETLLDYVEGAQIYLEEACEGAAAAHLQTIQEYYQARNTPIPGDQGTKYRPLPPELLYWTSTDWDTFLQTSPWSKVTPFHGEETNQGSPLQDYQGKILADFGAAQSTARVKAFEVLAERLTDAAQKKKPVILACFSEGARDRLLTILEEHEIKGVQAVDAWPGGTEGAVALIYPLERGYELPHLLVISEQDLLGDRVARAVSKRRKTDQFFLEVAQLTPGDLVVHRDQGIGRYEGLMTIKVGAASHDCLCLIYDGGDKLFLPVENIEMITRYGGEGAVAQLDRLGSSAWQMRKAKVKKRIREVADYLIKLAAERALHEGQILEKHPTKYEEFCSHFPYLETEDQQRAIEEVLEDMASGKPMDRLVCGDVGFGKTEVALRAAFVAVSQGKQVAIIVPTTLLCRQHYRTFRDRFQGFPYRVEQISRLVKPAQALKIRQDVTDGKVQIIIATHALLSDKTSFTDLGLLIIDEEHHFGVKQKEKLKKMCTDVHVLTLTATPIPRTLQLALSGVREMSLITTPPIDRLAIRTFVMPFDGVVIREAILREYYRGGQIFFVSPRLDDLAKMEHLLRELIPEVRLIMAHGQMNPTQLEEVMNAFYDRDYDVLLSTNIVESGIDIATANTLIIHRADLFGLAQLYQLRGRVGRGKIQGYAYLTLPEGQVVSANATKRLEVMQTLDNLGAGFTLASYDMDIRGTGNIVGEEQSGHMREVGVELYQHLLQEAILMVRAEQELGASPDFEWAPQINLGASVLIPEAYVQDLTLRLGLYRRIAALENRDQIDAFAAEMIDRFGPLPGEVSNLFELIEIKGLCRQADIEKLDIGPKGALITFRNNRFQNIQGLLEFVQSQKGTAKLRPDNKLVFIRAWDTLGARMKGAKQICTFLSKLKAIASHP
ncbi:MAG: transcription-repair coupling factor [Alphaproteobacteria bacterium]|jgi:transcription-repair coupling factor (superfamily II helicase)|nr:transcription-repair coupling factor [Alphaproteobacteria bacterium]